MARSMGNTQVTPIRPAIPPLINLAGKLVGEDVETGRDNRKRNCDEGTGGNALLL